AKPADSHRANYRQDVRFRGFDQTDILYQKDNDRYSLEGSSCSRGDTGQPGEQLPEGKGEYLSLPQSASWVAGRTKCTRDAGATEQRQRILPRLTMERHRNSAAPYIQYPRCQTDQV